MRLVALLAALLAGCAASSPSARERGALAWVFGHGKKPPPLATRKTSPPRTTTSAALVEKALLGQGLVFGTDGSVGALWAYMRTRHHVVPTSRARVGDVVFFALEPGARGCDEAADHVGIVDAVDGNGRISFRELRGGQVQRSVFHPERPAERRDPDGRLLNTFLRPKRPEDAPGTRYFAGQLVCGVTRVASETAVASR